MKISYLLLLVALVACNTQTETKPEVFWGHHYAFAKDIAYGDKSQQKMDIWFQGQWIGEPNYFKSDTKLHPTLIYIHGGGWMGGSKDGIMPFILAYLERGYNVVTLDYRVGEASAPAAVDDCMKALFWLTKEGTSYNIDLQHLIISGESAGGHLALITGLLNSIPGSHPYYAGDKLKINAIVNWFGVTDIKGIDQFYTKRGEEKNFASVWVGDKSAMDSISENFSPMAKITANSPPVISIHGQKDSVVPYEQAVQLHSLLKKNHIRNDLVTIPEGRHLGFTDEEFQKIYSRIFSFIEN
jgi:acetyl esterase/lipase